MEIFIEAGFQPLYPVNPHEEEILGFRAYPSVRDVPADVERYSQKRARDDILGVLDALGIRRAHVVGNSMGGFATLHFGMAHPSRALSLVVAGCGDDSSPASGTAATPADPTGGSEPDPGTTGFTIAQRYPSNTFVPGAVRRWRSGASPPRGASDVVVRVRAIE